MGPNKSSVKRKVHNTKVHSFINNIKNLEKSHISELPEQLKTLEQKEPKSPKRSRQQEIIKLKADIKITDNKKLITK